MTPKRISSAGFADNRHGRAELLFAMFVTPEAGQEDPIPGAEAAAAAGSPAHTSLAGGCTGIPRAQILTGIPGS